MLASKTAFSWLFVCSTLDLISTGLAPVSADLSDSHQNHQIASHLTAAAARRDTLFVGPQSDADDTTHTNYQLDELPSSNQDLSNSINTNEPTTGYYYPDQTGHQETIDAPMLSNSNSNNNNNYQGLPEKEYLSRHLTESTCRLDRGCQRKDRLNNTYLSHCTRYKLENLFSNEILMSIMHDSAEECAKILDEFIQLDELINHFDQLFKKLLTRYNCHNGYSVKWSCEDCKKAYQDWLCATNLPYYMNGERIKPCISFCERVEQRCPYLHPITKEQYGGQPAFICRDPNIPFVPEITPDIPHSEPAKCYDLCHLSDNATELLIDSLSKYEQGKCPTKGSIAEEVRSDPLYCSLNLDHERLANQSKDSPHHINPPADPYDPNPMAEYPAENDETATLTITTTSATDFNGSLPERPPPVSGTKQVHVHIKKLEELREVLSVNDRSIDHAKHWSTHRSHHTPARARRQVDLEQPDERFRDDHTNTAERCDRCFAQ